MLRFLFTADTRMELLSRASILLLEPIPESRFTRIGGELYRLRNRAVPCIRPREAASESLATAIDGGYQVEQLESWRWGGNPGQ